MKIQILGAGREVGGSGVSILDKNTNILMDYGLKVQSRPPSGPIPTKEVNAIFLTHAHLDHSGYLPVLYKNESPKLFTNDITLEAVNLLLEDSLKIAKREKYFLDFGRKEIKAMNRNAILLNYNESIKVNEFECKLLDAGHIPGSTSVLLEHKLGKRIFYTGDIKIESSRLLNGAEIPEKTDVLITESTYSASDHPGRE